MNNKTIDKLKLLLAGIAVRIEDNKDYFVKIEGSFKSGGKVFPLMVDVNGSEFVYCCGGAAVNGNANLILSAVAEDASRYDSLTLEYSERGEVIAIVADDKKVTTKRMDRKENNQEADTASISARKYLIEPNRAKKLLQAIGVMSPDGKIKNDKIRKYNQIDHFVEIISDLLDGADNEITILDCGCGKSYLSFVLNHYICEVLKKKCKIVGIDIREDVIETCKKTAETLEYRNMKFLCCDLNVYKPSCKIDLCISLHACDTATDMALAAAVKAGARAIVAVPCCHKELIDKYSFDELGGVIKHGILKARVSDILTDGLRGLLLEANGYEVTMLEYISPLETPKNLMIKARKKCNYSKSAAAEYEALKKKIGTATYMETLLYEDMN